MKLDKFLASATGFYIGDVTNVLDEDDMKKCYNSLSDGQKLPFAVWFDDNMPSQVMDDKGNIYELPGKNIGLVPKMMIRDNSQSEKGVIIPGKSTARFIVNEDTIKIEFMPYDEYNIKFL